MSADPLVSVVIPTKNRAHYLDEALQSVMHCIEYTTPPCDAEIIVVDDASTDETPSVVKRYPARLITSRGTGEASGRNTGVSAARGRYIAFLDDDDIWFQNHLQLHLNTHETSPTIGISYSQGMLADQRLQPVSPAYPTAPLASGWIQKYVFTGAVQQLNTMLIQRQLFDEVGGFDEALEVGCDFDIVQKFAAHAEFGSIEEVTTLWRQHSRPGSGSYRRWRRHRQITKEIYRRGLALCRPSFGMRVDRQIRNRGWGCFDAVQEAERCVRDDQRLEAAKLLAAACWVSPAHAFFRQSAFWTVAASVMRGRAKPATAE